VYLCLAPRYPGSDCSLILYHYLTPRHPGWKVYRPVHERLCAVHCTGAKAEAWRLLIHTLKRFPLSLYICQVDAMGSMQRLAALFDLTRAEEEERFSPAAYDLTTDEAMVGQCRLTLVEGRVQSAWFQVLKLKHDKLLSTFAFNFNLRHYTMRVAAVFAVYDKNSDGIIDMEELGELLCSAALGGGDKFADDEVKLAMKMLDSNGGGSDRT